MAETLKFLFWNLHGQDLRDPLLTCAASVTCDFLLVAESQGLPNTLNTLDGPYNEIETIETQKVRVYARAGAPQITAVSEGLATRYWALRVNSRTSPFLLVVAHLHSKVNTDECDRDISAQKLAASVRQLEAETDLPSIICGDLNLDPFDRPMLSTIGLHAVGCLTTAQRESRVVDRERYSMFYNPMWSLLGDRSEGPPGTFFHLKGHASPGWHTYDQVVLRPCLGQRLKEIRVLTESTGVKFTNSLGRPSLSDHLPIYFEIEDST